MDMQNIRPGIDGDVVQITILPLNQWVDLDGKQ